MAEDPTTNGHAPAGGKTVIELVKGDRPPAAPLDTSQPIRPEWLRDRQAFTSTTRVVAKRASWRTGKFLAQVPIALAWLAAYSPLGLAKLVAKLAQYLYDYDTASLRHQHADTSDTKSFMQVSAARRANLKARWMVATTLVVLLVSPPLAILAPGWLAALVGLVVAWWVVKMIPGRGLTELVVAAGAGLAIWWWLPSLLVLVPRPPVWLVVTLATLVVLVLGWFGRPQNRQLVDTTKLSGPATMQKPSADLVVAALVASVPGITDKNSDQIRVHAPGVARARGGYHLSLELPHGATVSDVMEKREQFAAALRRPLGSVWPAKGKMHPGHLRLFIGDEPMATADQAAWKLASGKRVDVFDSLDLFTDQEGRWVSLSLMYKALVIGGAPGFGKSFCLRSIGAAAAMDPRTRLIILDGKANGDMRPFRLVADGYYEDDDEAGIREQLAAVKAVREEMRRRAKFLRELPAEENPEDKVTSALVDKYPHLAPIFLLIDEAQVYTEHEDRKIREEFIAAAADIVRRGRSAGIVPVFCTQKPSADVLPTAIVDNCSVRLCFKVNGQRANDAVLGVEMHSSGIKATKFGPDDRGLAYLKGDGSEAQVVRSVFGFDKPTSESLLAKARALREKLGMLTGYAAGDEAEREEQQVSMLEDARTVMDEAGMQRMHLAQMLDSLQDLRPATWGHLDVEALGSMLRAAGVPTGQVKMEGRNTTGVRREHLNIAATSDEDPDDRGGDVVPIRR